MDAIYEFQGTRFIWDERKARSNLTKHGVAFEAAVTVFYDPFVRIEDAGRNEEARYAAIGFDVNGRLLYVVHIEFEGAAIRLISARKVTNEERQRYDR